MGYTTENIKNTHVERKTWSFGRWFSFSIWVILKVQTVNFQGCKTLKDPPHLFKTQTFPAFWSVLRPPGGSIAHRQARFQDEDLRIRPGGQSTRR